MSRYLKRSSALKFFNGIVGHPVWHEDDELHRFDLS